MISMRPSGINTVVGYQRPCSMSGCSVQVSFHGSNVKIFFSPRKLLLLLVAYARLPPATTTRPSGSSAWPAHQMLAGFILPSAGSFQSGGVTRLDPLGPAPPAGAPRKPRASLGGLGGPGRPLGVFC